MTRSGAVDPETARALQQAHRGLDTAADEVGEAIAGVPAHVAESARILRAEILVARRRLENLQKFLGCHLGER